MTMANMHKSSSNEEHMSSNSEECIKKLLDDIGRWAIRKSLEAANNINTSNESERINKIDVIENDLACCLRLIGVVHQLHLDSVSIAEEKDALNDESTQPITMT